MNSNNPQPIISYDGHTSNVTSVGFQKDGKWMYTGSEDGTGGWVGWWAGGVLVRAAAACSGAPPLAHARVELPPTHLPLQLNCSENLGPAGAGMPA